MLLQACSSGPGTYALASKTAPDAKHVALVRLTRCGQEWCESLWVGTSPDAASQIATLPHDAERCGEITWTKDGKRVGFVINGAQLRLYDAQTHAPAGQFDLVPRDTQRTSRIARGVTFSDNGAAITFDDCPRDQSGCRPGMVALR
jgi:hypothetical protein